VTLFKQALDEAIKFALANDDLAKELYRAGDVGHLQRWRDDGRADEIWEALRWGTLDARTRCVLFIYAILGMRHLAEEADQLNKAIPRLKRLAPKERRRAVNRLKKGELSPQEFTEVTAFFEKAETGRATDFFEPIFAVRSDERGTRQCTIFCRLVSDLVRRGPHWHDQEVAWLAEIALNRKDITIDMVRSYREAGRREATRKIRRT
jgi:hypothetical protein